MAPESRILVVDDSEESRRILADILGRKGYTVNTAPDGEWAWMLLQQTWFSYDLVITDLIMPGMSGIELLAKIRACSPWIHVVLITGHLAHEVASRARELGAFAVLPKPCGIEKLNGTVRLALLNANDAKGGDIYEEANSPCDGPHPLEHGSRWCGLGEG